LKPFYGTPPADWGTPPSSSDTVPQHDNSQLNDGPPEQTAEGDFADPYDGADAVDQLPGYETTTRRSTLRFQYRLGHNDVPVATVVGRRSSKTSSLQLVGAIIVFNRAKNNLLCSESVAPQSVLVVVYSERNLWHDD